MPLVSFPLAKCDLCAGRVEVGKIPACVATCPTGALRFEEVTEAFEAKDRMVLGGNLTGYRTYIRRP
jgi:Fe-S-cluster-containing dehydrogenase component